jgi:hypothetical protein
MGTHGRTGWPAPHGKHRRTGRRLAPCPVLTVKAEVSRRRPWRHARQRLRRRGLDLLPPLRRPSVDVLCEACKTKVQAEAVERVALRRKDGSGPDAGRAVHARPSAALSVGLACSRTTQYARAQEPPLHCCIWPPERALVLIAINTRNVIPQFLKGDRMPRGALDVLIVHGIGVIPMRSRTNSGRNCSGASRPPWRICPPLPALGRVAIRHGQHHPGRWGPVTERSRRNSSAGSFGARWIFSAGSDAHHGRRGGVSGGGCV